MKAYIDTNIFDYMILKHPVYGEACRRICEDVRDGKIDSYCSLYVPIEILGSIAQINSGKAAVAIAAFFSFPIKIIELDERLIREAGKISLATGLSYDAIHAAAMKKYGLNTIITEDIEHWKKIKGIKIIRPLEYTGK